jgi:hypothetical protein
MHAPNLAGMVRILFDVFEQQDCVWKVNQSVRVPHSDDALIMSAYQSDAVA